jgi:hypothetical protein
MGDDAFGNAWGALTGGFDPFRRCDAGARLCGPVVYRLQDRDAWRVFRVRWGMNMAVTDFWDAVEVAVLERRSAAYHRAAAARARRLRAEATTAWSKEYLTEAVARHEQIAAEIERTS